MSYKVHARFNVVKRGGRFHGIALDQDRSSYRPSLYLTHKHGNKRVRSVKDNQVFRGVKTLVTGNPFPATLSEEGIAAGARFLAANKGGEHEIKHINDLL